MIETKYKKHFTVISMTLAAIFAFIAFPSEALADAGPKPSITIKATNMPDGICYMDLLVEVDRPGETDPDYLSNEYDSEMVSILSGYYEDGWGPSVVNRENIIFSDIKCKVTDGECTKSFGYMPPDRFKIIVITEEGKITTSNIIEKKAFESTIDFDYMTGVAKERPMLPSFIIKFVITLLLTLLIEGLLLLAFRFGFSKYWGWVLGVNVVTQVFLYAAIIFGTMAGGIFLAILLYIFAEFIIFIGETILYAFILKSRSIGYRLGYSFAANALSFIAGIVLFGLLS